MKKRRLGVLEVENGEILSGSEWEQERFKRLKEVADSDTRLNIRLTNDFAFKKAFRNKKALAGLLSALLEIPLEDIKTLEFPDTYLHGDYAEDREGILDVKVHLNNDKKINVEMQIKVYPFWEERTLFYLSRMFAENFKKGEEYSSLETCIHISILGFSLAETEGFYSVIELRNRKTGRLYSDKLSLRVLYLNQLENASETERLSDVYQWAKLISARDWEVLKTMAEQNEAMQEAYKEVEKINADTAMRWQYLREEMRASDEATLRHGCFLDGEKKSTERYSQLILKLAEDGRQEEIVKAAANPEYLKKLYAEYQL